MANTGGLAGTTILYAEQRASLAGSRLSLLSIVKGVRQYGIVPLVVCGSDGPFVDELRSEAVDVTVIDISTLFSLSPRRLVINVLSLIKLCSSVHPSRCEKGVAGMEALA
jgi:hypothetical protein